MSARDERASMLVKVLLERAHARQPMAELLAVAEPRLVQVAAELLALSMALLVERRVEAGMTREDDLLEQVASQAAIILTLTDPGAAS